MEEKENRRGWEQSEKELKRMVTQVRKDTDALITGGDSISSFALTVQTARISGMGPGR